MLLVFICHSLEALCGLSLFLVLVLVRRGFSPNSSGCRGGQTEAQRAEKMFLRETLPPPPTYVKGTPVLTTFSSKSNNLNFDSVSNAYH